MLKNMKLKFLSNSKTSICLLLTLSYSGINPLFAQGTNGSITIGNYIKIHSDVLHEERIVLVSLPEDYRKSDKTYPVLFKLDGDKDNFLQASSAAYYLSDMADDTPDPIIIGIENTDRYRDMLPDEKANSFIQFLHNELIPFVDKNYRTNGFRILSGQSLSSLFALYSFLEQPDLFDAYILGSFGLYKESLAVLFDNELKRNGELKSLGKKYLFVGNGKLDTNDPDGTITKRGDQFLELLKHTVPSSVIVKSKLYEEEGHVPYPTIYDGLKWIYSNEKFTEKAQSRNMIKLVHGTFINFVYQDERNKYMNPEGADLMSPEFWRAKINELSEMGMEYIILMYVANEGKSFYPSEFMQPYYPAGAESPVEAIMKAADEHNLKVFMSTGWAKNQDDNPGLPEIRSIQVKIMHETARLFSDHKSFYGWYLPCEDVVGPYLSQKAVDAVNSLTEEAKSLTPKARVLISPYGLRFAKFDDRRFAEQIAKLKVDIIAYQDEIGCVVEPLPLPHMKENFVHLRDVHNKTKIELWSNNELFTWEKGLNVRPSALIPAPFPRFLSQLAGATKAGVDEVISFAVCGILDKPDSKFPIGQPVYANKGYQEYMDWKAGKGRWPLLAATFTGNIKHDAIAKPTELRYPPSPAYPNGNLTDGKFGVEDYTDKNWLGFEKKDMVAIIDLSTEKSVQTIAARFLTYKLKNIFLPTSVEFSVSSDGKKFKTLKTVMMDQCLNDRYDCWIDIATADNLSENARFIRVYAINGTGQWIFADEIMVNPEY
jgi:predicted alpha/beta superfamily hydrolase